MIIARTERLGTATYEGNQYDVYGRLEVLEFFNIWTPVWFVLTQLGDVVLAQGDTLTLAISRCVDNHEMHNMSGIVHVLMKCEIKEI